MTLFGGKIPAYRNKLRLLVGSPAYQCCKHLQRPDPGVVKYNTPQLLLALASLLLDYGTNGKSRFHSHELNERSGVTLWTLAGKLVCSVNMRQESNIIHYFIANYEYREVIWLHQYSLDPTVTQIRGYNMKKVLHHKVFKIETDQSNNPFVAQSDSVTVYQTVNLVNIQVRLIFYSRQNYCLLPAVTQRI